MSTKPIILAGAALVAGSIWGQSAPAPTVTVSLTSAPPYSVTGDLFILKADPNSPGLRCPVLVVEGFDISNSMGWEALYGLLNQENLAEGIMGYGRDLLVLNFTDSAADILANAALTASAIGYINAHRADPDDKFTAVGVSLGGLAARKALVDTPAHDVDTWISFDAPHEGANIPLGLQEFFEYFSTVNRTEFDQARSYLAALDRPAARQLLLAHHSRSPDAPAGGSAPERQDFVNAMNAVGYPTDCKTIAISNGSGFGEKLPFNPGELIIHWDYNGGGFLDPNIDADVYALPLSPNTPATVFYGRFQVVLYGRAPKTVASYSPLALDNAPGGYRPTYFELFANLPPGYIDGDDYCSQTNHCFVPTVSALGIPIANLESNLASQADLLALSPFDEIHYADQNEAHVEINPRNKRWLIRALLEGYDTDGDGFDDYQEFLMGTGYDAPDSALEVNATVELQPGGDRVLLSWALFPNVQYEVWFTGALDQPWQLLETLPPSADPAAAREYEIDAEAPAGFFLVVAAPADPVTD